jgi:DnaJ-class molecular chaperone
MLNIKKENVTKELKNIVLKCPNCDGIGTIHDEFYSPFFDCILHEPPCPICKGTGKVE